ncbi:MAG: biopolymer transporter ExbD [Calothrix sp. SM1_7_51]|nr:biopolymer transporter ExbD [Calothrix sp. SM1_7_51]
MKINLPSSSTDDVQVNIVPLIDVIFCILTFFLLASLQFTRREAINIDLPRADSGTQVQKNSPSGVGVTEGRQIVPFNIDAVGQAYIGQEPRPVQREQIQEAFKNYLQQDPNAVLALGINSKASYNEVIQIMDLWRQLGGRSVSFITQPTASTGTTNTNTTTPTPGVPIPNLPTNPGLAPTAPIPNTAPLPPTNPQPNLNLGIPIAPAPLPAQPQPGAIAPANPVTTPANP